MYDVTPLYIYNYLKILTTHSNRLNCGQGTMGFLHSACWFVRYSVIMESRVIWDSPIPGMHPVVTVDVFFRRGDELITLPCSHEICFCKERLLQLPPGADPCTFLKHIWHFILKTAWCISFKKLKYAQLLKYSKYGECDYSKSLFLNSLEH